MNSYSFGALTAVAIAASPGGLVRAASGTVTCTTSVAHKALPGEVATIVGSTSVGGTRFDANYIIKTATFGSSILTLIPIDDIVLHQAPDTGGVGTVTLIQMEQPAALTGGTAFGLLRTTSSEQASPIGVDGVFDGAPGVFEVDIQVAELDVPLLYQVVLNGAISTVDATNNTFHFDMNISIANFVRAFLRSRTNAVNLAVAFRG